MKKLFIISGSFFLLVLVFLAVYNFAFRHNNTNPIADPAKKEEVEKNARQKAKPSRGLLRSSRSSPRASSSQLLVRTASSTIPPVTMP
ncbi:MAG: hypothetical protein IPJ68_05660 [Candidatus Moraniibacteriota bacterium]|nr:MAG: hypothetical protein IPJ68_05660 [Candidatus Moranbacteria bacterium]